MQVHDFSCLIVSVFAYCPFLSLVTVFLLKILLLCNIAGLAVLVLKVC